MRAFISLAILTFHLDHTVLNCLRLIVDVVEVNCPEAVEDRIPTFREKLQQWFDDAILHAPSIVFFDDLDRLMPAELEV